MRRRRTRARFTITAVTLLVLVTMFAWTLKHRERNVDEPPVAQETEIPQTSQSDTEPKEDLEAETVQVEADIPETEEEKEPDVEDKDPEIDMRASFVTDYTSAPLLNTTQIKYLTIQQGGQPGEVRLNWFSPSSSKGQVVLYNVNTGESQTYDASVGASATEAGLFYHKAAITGLQENTTYAYKVGDKNGWSPEYKFSTQSFSGDFTFLVTSDAQIGQSEMEVMQETVDRWDKVVTRLKKLVPESAFLVHLGDQVAGYNDTEQYRGFFEHLALYQTPMVPIVGNHDIDSWNSGGGPWFYERYNVPNRSKIGCNWADTDGDYWFRYGNVLFMVLNSNTVYGPEAHAEFVDQVCAENPDATWKIIMVHHSAYSSVEKYQFEAENCREHYAYLAETYDIDLFFSGHDHAYTRTALMNGWCEPLGDYDYSSGTVLADPQGALYVNCSTASGCLYQPLYENYAAVVQAQPEAPTAIRVDVTDHTLKLTAYLVDSWEVFDEITLQKS